MSTQPLRAIASPSCPALRDASGETSGHARPITPIFNGINWSVTLATPHYELKTQKRCAIP